MGARTTARPRTTLAPTTARRLVNQGWQNRFLGGTSYSPLLCYECHSGISNKHCLSSGKIIKCVRGQQSCRNTVRVQHGKVEIQKGCKQTRACQNNVMHYAKTYRSKSHGMTQCSFITRQTLCRCCCKNDKCNGNPIYCNIKDDNRRYLKGITTNHSISLSALEMHRYLFKASNVQNNQRQLNNQLNNINYQSRQQVFTNANYNKKPRHVCDNNPCRNGGTCVRGWGPKYHCMCAANWTDSHCNTPKSLPRRRQQYQLGAQQG